MADIIQIRRDTSANWTTANPTLAQGEPGFETDTGKFKIGNGSTAWNSMSYFLFYTTVEINTQTDDYTLTLSDSGKLIDMNKATALTLTIPKNSSVAFPVGTVITVRQKGEGALTISPVDEDVVINVYNSNYKMSGQYAMAVLIKVAENTWTLEGNLQAGEE